jgi:hypothetical protein
VLVLPVYRGGEKFQRALESIRATEQYFRRIVISLNGPLDSLDAERAQGFLADGSTKVEVVQTGSELPWMQHQYFWLAHLEATGERPHDWVYWFAHDDEIRARGLAQLTDEHGGWPLTPQTIYLGPWGMRYDPPGAMYSGDPGAPLESWTSFPLAGPLRLSVGEWVSQQLVQPTYINMSGCVTQLASFQALRNFPIPKPGGMRIEMATAAAPNNRYVQEFSEPVVTTYTSKGSDRTTYAAVARKDDAHMAAWLGRYITRHPAAAIPSARAALMVGAGHLKARLGRGSLPEEDWRYRETVQP